MRPRIAPRSTAWPSLTSIEERCGVERQQAEAVVHDHGVAVDAEVAREERRRPGWRPGPACARPPRGRSRGGSAGRRPSPGRRTCAGRRRPTSPGRCAAAGTARSRGRRPAERARERHELLGVRLPQLAVDLRGSSRGGSRGPRGPASAPGSPAPPSSRKASSSSIVSRCGGFGKKRSTKATSERVAGVVLGHDAQRARRRRGPTARRRARAGRPAARPGSGAPGKNQAPGAHAVARGRSRRPGRRRRPSRPGPRSAASRQQRQRGRRRGAPAAAAPRTTGAGWRSHVGARSATTRTIASPSFSSGSGRAPDLDAQLLPLRARARPAPRAGAAGASLCATTRAAPPCSTSTRRPARPRPGADATTTRLVFEPIAFASLRISTAGAGPTRSVATRPATTRSTARSRRAAFRNVFIVRSRAAPGARDAAPVGKPLRRPSSISVLRLVIATSPRLQSPAPRPYTCRGPKLRGL